MDISYLAAVFLSRFKYFGILASLITIIALVFPMPWYSGRNGERYSVLNHFVSELGEVGVSKAARVFNGGLILAGALFVPFIIGLGISMGNGWAKLGMVLGVWTAVSLILVGVFPMDKLEPHVRATLSFFNGGWLAIILFTFYVERLDAAGRDASSSPINGLVRASLHRRVFGIFACRSTVAVG
jgi:hypothetical membrane protein